jgi:hypothetical protein
MDDTPSLDRIKKLQFHYWFADKTHTMDAWVLNKCEREILEIVKITARLCDVSVTAETEPSGKGGLKSWLTLTAKSPKRTPQEKIALVTILVSGVLVSGGETPLAARLDERLVGASSPEALAHEQHMQLLVEKLKAEIAQRMPLLEQQAALKKRRSNYFEILRKYKKVNRVSIQVTDGAKKPVMTEQFIERNRFEAFKVSAGARATHLMENAVVTIISPVLVAGKHKWKGTYNNKPISFTMKSGEFMALVQSGKVEFKSGTSINCTLEIEKKLNPLGAEKITGYTIVAVSSYFENGKTIETQEAKQKQKESAASKKQLDLFAQ